MLKRYNGKPSKNIPQTKLSARPNAIKAAGHRLEYFGRNVVSIDMVAEIFHSAQHKQMISLFTLNAPNFSTRNFLWRGPRRPCAEKTSFVRARFPGSPAL
jgi:hypothetical protein